MICITRRRISARASANQGAERGDFNALCGLWWQGIERRLVKASTAGLSSNALRTLNPKPLTFRVSSDGLSLLLVALLGYTNGALGVLVMTLDLYHKELDFSERQFKELNTAI